MAIVHELHEKNEWWLNELRSLGLKVNDRNDFNDLNEMSNLANMIKQHYYKDFRTFLVLLAINPLMPSGAHF
jgi:hypothetical protein